jgi:lysophospholipase L1-like esterase/DNA-binding beta-propeller fold protein YncE
VTWQKQKTRSYQTKKNTPMKHPLGLTTLLVAMLLLNPGATTSESAKVGQAPPSPTLLPASAKADQDISEAVRELAKPTELTTHATRTKSWPAADFQEAYNGAPSPKPAIENDVKRKRAVAPRKQPSSIEIALVANAQAGTVALVDVASRAVLGTININPAGVKSQGPGAPNYAQDTDVSPDGRTLYVSRGYVGDIVAFDIASGRLLWRRSLNTGRADHMTLTPDGRSLFVSALLDNRVYKVAAATGELTGHLMTGVYPHDNKVSRDGRRLYNTSIGPLSSLPRQAGAPPLAQTPVNAFQLTIADAGRLRTRDRIRLDNGIRPWQFTPDEKGLYAQLSNQHAVVAYNLAARKVVKRLELPVKPGVTVADWDFEAPHHGLALTPDGKTLCLAGRASDYAALVRAPALSLIATIPVGDAPGWAETADNGRLCLIANTRSDDLSIISIAERREILRLPMGDGPKHITVARIPATVVAAFKAHNASRVNPPVEQSNQSGRGAAPAADQPVPRSDQNSQIAHTQLLEKARKGRIDIYFEGDSITRRWGASDEQYKNFLANWRQNFFGWNAADFGWGGDTTQNILWRLHNGELDNVHPKIIVVLAGTNNVGKLSPEGSQDPRVAEVTRGIKAILEVCRQKAPKATIVLMGILPRNDNLAVMPIINQINANIAKFADGKRVRYLNINDRLADKDGRLFEGMTNGDGLHLDVKGYQVWADALKPIFKELLGPPAKEDHAPPPTGDPSAARRSSG